MLQHSAKGTSWTKKEHKYYKKERSATGKINYYYKKGMNAYEDNIVDDNEFITDASNYEEQIAKIAQNPEWRDIIKRNDPEYVRIGEDGKKKYLIDDYLVKKKHPELDVLDDIASGREITINKISNKAIKAGIHDYVKTGATLAAVAAKVLIEKFKVSQGSYAKEMQNASNQGESLVNDALKLAIKYSKGK